MSDGYAGQQQSTDGNSEFNAITAIALAMIARIPGATLVKVTSIANSGGVSPVGMVDVQPLVNQLDGAGLATPHGLLHSLPYFRLQGGTDAVILDPKIGDIGIAIFAGRDISSVSNTKGQANPGSGRRHSMADGLYIGGVLNGIPAQYVQFNASGITIHSPTKITLSAPTIEFNAEQTITSTAGTSITDNAPTSEINAPVIALNGNITQTTGGGSAGVTMQGPVHVIGTITSDTEVIAVTTPLHTHQHLNSGGAGNSGNPTP